MVLFVVFGVLAVFASAGVDCRYWAQHSQSTSSGDGYINTITETDDNGRKEVIRSRTVPDGNQQVNNNLRSNQEVQSSDFAQSDWYDSSENSIVRNSQYQPMIKSQDREMLSGNDRQLGRGFGQRGQGEFIGGNRRQFDSGFEHEQERTNSHRNSNSFGHFRESRRNIGSNGFGTSGFGVNSGIGDQFPASPDLQTASMQQIIDHLDHIDQVYEQMNSEFQKYQQGLNSHGFLIPVNNLADSTQNIASNDPNHRVYGYQSSAFSKSSNINGVEDRKEGGTTTINDNGKIATFSTGDKLPRF